MRHTYRISRPDQIAALASPARVEILDVLASLGVSSVAAIAAALGRPADALYYHLRFLVRVGLVRHVGKGRGRRREQALYKTVAPRLSVAYDPEDPANTAAMTRTAAGLLRLGVRDFRVAFAPGTVVSGPRRELWIGRVAARLSGADVERVNRLLKATSGVLEASRPRSKERLFALTFLLVPLERRRKRRKP